MFFLLSSLKGFLGMPYQLLTYWKRFGHYTYFYCGSKIVIVCSVLSNVLWIWFKNVEKMWKTVQCVQCSECSVHSLVMCQQTWHTAADVISTAGFFLYPIGILYFIWRSEAAYRESQAAPCYCCHGDLNMLPLKNTTLFQDYSLASVQEVSWAISCLTEVRTHSHGCQTRVQLWF